MFIWKERKDQLSELEKVATEQPGLDGINKRAIGLFPQPKEDTPRKVDFVSQIKYHKLLVNMEGQEDTCVMRLISNRNRSRAGVLIFRGRVLGAIYGRVQESGVSQLLGQDAYSMVRLEMLSSDTIVDTYKIDDKTAIACSAMFHGELYEPPGNLSAREVFDYSMNHLLESMMPGTIIINRDDAHTGIIYIFKGKVHGVFCFDQGWLEPTRQAAETLLSTIPNPTISASKLLCCNIWELKDYTFSLTGIEESTLSASQHLSPSLDYAALKDLDKRGESGLSKAMHQCEDGLGASKLSGKAQDSGKIKFGTDRL